MVDNNENVLDNSDEDGNTDKNTSRTLITSDTKRQQAVDVATASVKGIISQIPIAGPVLAEILGVYIPNRRQERIITMLEMFAEKIAHLDEKVREAKMQTEQFADILEEAMWQSARSLTDERRRYIANLLANALTEETISHLQRQRLLDILGPLNDAEILTLVMYSLSASPQRQREFIEMHNEAISVPIVVIGGIEDKSDQAAIQRTYRRNLINIGLLEPKFKKPKKNEPPEFDLKTGQIVAASNKITTLGQLLLREIGASDANSWEDNFDES
jgi:hypothetical protein